MKPVPDKLVVVATGLIEAVTDMVVTSLKPVVMAEVGAAAKGLNEAVMVEAVLGLIVAIARIAAMVAIEAATETANATVIIDPASF